MGDLLTLAHDLADRLLAAFDKSANGLPHPRVNLRHGIPQNGILESCTAGAGSLILEFGELRSQLRHDQDTGLLKVCYSNGLYQMPCRL